MSLTGRDRKIVLIVVPLALLLGYWFLLLGPKRDEAAATGEKLTQVEQQRDQAVTTAAALQSSRTSFVADYTALVRLGKAIPTRVDMPSLIVQLDAAARGTGIRFKKVATGAQTPASAPPPAGAGGAAPAPGSGDGSQPAGAGGAPAQSTPGQQAEGAATKTDAAANAQNQGNANAAQQSGLDANDASTSTAARQGGLPVGGGATGQSGAASAGSSCAAGLVCVPLELQFSGRFFRLADFFHRLKRFVRVANDRIEVRGRLLTIDTVKLSSDALSFPGIKAEVKATVYLAPPQQGTTAGATPGGPAQTPPGAGGSGAQGVPAPPASSTTPAATSTP